MSFVSVKAENMPRESDKKSWRFIGFDDSFKVSGSISELKGKNAVLVGCITSGTIPEGFVYDEIEIDGMDATRKVISIIKRSKFRNQLRCIFLSGITFGGFNIVDISDIFDKTKIPVICVMRKYPNMDVIKKALLNVESFEKRLKAIENAGDILRIRDVYVQMSGCDVESAKKFLILSTREGKMPEPLRLAHMVASAITHGESRGKA